MIKTRKPMKIISISVAVMLGLSMTATAVTADAASSDAKEETVYVITDCSGSQTEMIVSDHLINKTESDVLNDVSSLKDIENVKGNEKFTHKKDNSLTWEADGNDIYYQGSTDKKAPINMKIRYYLDGKEVSALNLKGKSGKVRITINYSNNHHENLDGKVINVPFVVLSGMIIEDDCLKNIEITNGKVIDDGENQFVAAMAVPGLSDSLGISEEQVGFGDTVEITGVAKDFNISDMMTIVTNDFFKDVDMGELSELDMDDQINELDKAAKQLKKGTLELYNGVEQLNSKSGKLTGGISKLSSGAEKLKAGTDSAVKGSRSLAAGAAALQKSVNEELVPGVESLAAGSSAVLQGAQQISSKVGSVNSTDSSTLVGGAAQLSAGLNSNDLNNAAAAGQTTVNSTISKLDELKADENLTSEQKAKIGEAEEILKQSLVYQSAVSESLNKLSDGAGALYTGAQQLAAGINGDGTSANPGLVNGAGTVSSGTKQLLDKVKGTADDTQSLASGSQSLSEGAEQLTAGQTELNEGAKSLAAGMAQLESSTGKLVSGVNTLDLGAMKLHKGMSQFYDEGISKIVELYNSDIKGITQNFDTLVSAGKQYDIFTEKVTGTESSVKFIYRTSIIPEE